MEMFKDVNGISTVITNEVSVWRTEHRYNLHYQNDFLKPNSKAVSHGRNSPLYLDQNFGAFFQIDSNKGVSVIVLKAQS